MAILPNPRHEAFARALAIGKTQSEAYAEAGYRPSEPHASRLAGNGKVVARLAELLGRAATRAVVSVETIAAQLDEDRRLAYAGASQRRGRCVYVEGQVVRVDNRSP